jgi:hypothetical protein
MRSASQCLASCEINTFVEVQIAVVDLCPNQHYVPMRWQPVGPFIPTVAVVISKRCSCEQAHSYGHRKHEYQQPSHVPSLSARPGH